MALFMKNDKKSTYISRPELLSFHHGGSFGNERNLRWVRKPKLCKKIKDFFLAKL